MLCCGRAKKSCCVAPKRWSAYEPRVVRIPEAEGGLSDFANLCFCCFWCNNFKQARSHARDPRTGRLVPLFNPRADHWDNHFRWSPTFTRLIGRTASGRATVEALRLNRQSLVSARQIWVRHGLHPPELHTL